MILLQIAQLRTDSQTRFSLLILVFIKWYLRILNLILSLLQLIFL
jgi:hypothetical protein